MRTHSQLVGSSLIRLVGRVLLGAILVAVLAGSAMAHAGSVYVPVDHWSYAAAERLATLTSTEEEVMGMRPWTRLQFARFLERAREMPHDAEADELQRTLEKEFAPELNAVPEKVALESAYTRSMQIAGQPLRDSYHFGQTIADDFGRPYGDGYNNIEGASGYVQDRAGMLYIRGEYQHGASLDRPSEAAIDSLAGRDVVLPSQINTQGGPEVNNPRLLDTYVGVSFGKWTGTLGKQSLWWGPDAGGAMQYTNNIEPIWMARLTNEGLQDSLPRQIAAGYVLWKAAGAHVRAAGLDPWRKDYAAADSRVLSLDLRAPWSSWEWITRSPSTGCWTATSA
jgi:hypothetical protein